MDVMGSVCVLVMLVVATSCTTLDLQTALKMAQCRAHCLDQCWERCALLAANFPIWSITCRQPHICDAGCKAACAFHSSHPKSTVPLSQHNSRLTLVFTGSSAQWTLSWGHDNPGEHVVFAVFTRTPGRSWGLKLQTADFSTNLEDVPSGSELKLVAVAESGILSVIITPYAPPAHSKSIIMPALALSQSQAFSEHSVTNGREVKGGLQWLLLHKTEVETSGLVAARVWWAPQHPSGEDYLVTWEVEGGGLKGHLYTDLPEVNLTLWPQTVYHVQVELITGPRGDAVTSAHLTLDTHNITLTHSHTHQNNITPTLPLVHKAVTPAQLEVLLGVGFGVLAVLLLVTLLFWRCKQVTGFTYNSTASSAKLRSWNRTLSDLRVDESLIIKSHKLPESNTPLCTPVCPPYSPVHNLPPPIHPSSSLLYLATPTHPSSLLLTLAHPSHAHVNLYSDVPPTSGPNKVSII
ncbi:uncharacterized protein [Cherax quadricarinatus]|uniref:uncharacterized protein isoform X2 n=1 Tax=Cherax quadricarinatus TaxID=27406 RepID=UPI002377F076|nr:uncharacterized protein LOC128693290 isoform X2 [Cherax quadricarinatus]